MPRHSPQSNKPRHRYVAVIVVIVIVIVGFLGLLYSANSQLATRGMTTTQQQLVTNVRDIYSTQTVTVTSISSASSAAVISSIATTVSGFGNGPVYPPYLEYQTCQYNCFYPAPGYNSLCRSIVNGDVECSGYVYHDTGGCVELAIPYVNPDYLESVAYQYYTLRNLPISFATSGWVTVTGQLHQGFNVSPSGGLCPANYIEVSAVS
ncbi:MAG: hypothetical protein ABSA92_07500 [Candidatus Bathyarchaeia archaeon]|jgi:hypothetical protein